MVSSQWVGVDNDNDNEIPEITVRSSGPSTQDDEVDPNDSQQLQKLPAKLNASLIRLKLLELMRNNDQVKLTQIIEEAKLPINAYDPQIANVLRMILHYAVQVAPVSMVQYIVSNNYIEDINAVDYDGNTPLHLATSSSRYEIVNFLMNLPGINDCIVNNAGKQAMELTDDLGIIQLMSDLRTKFVEINANELRRAFESKNYDRLTELLSNQRVSELLDINGTDPITGDGVLHEFVKKDDVIMCKFILLHGGDPFKRNTLGKLPIDLAFSQAMKKLLKDSSKEQSIVDPMGNGPRTSDQPPTYKGFLKKWTNFAGGYKLRWFVLDADGRLSYYKSPNDINKNCRGAISLANARLRMDSSEKSKFEIEIPSTPGTYIRWHLKSNHYIELNRWVWFLQNAIRYRKDIQRDQILIQGVPSNAQKKNLRNMESFDSKETNSTSNITQPFRAPQRAYSQGSIMSGMSASDNDLDSAEIVKTKSRVKKLRSMITPGSSNNSNKRLLEEIGENNRLRVSRRLPQSSGLSSVLSSSKANSIKSVSPAARAGANGVNGPGTDPMYDESDPEDDDETPVVDQETGDIIEKKSGPHGTQIIVLQNNLKIEVGSLKEFMIHGPPTSAEDIKFICIHTLNQVENLLQELKLTINARDEKILKKFNRQKEVSTLWENSIKSLEFEMREKEQKIVELEDKQLHLKKILKQKFGSTGQLATPNAEAEADTSAADSKDDELAKFLEEQDEDTDDEFFDAIGEGTQVSTVPPTSNNSNNLSLPPPPAFSPPPPPPVTSFSPDSSVTPSSPQMSLNTSIRTAPSPPRKPAPPTPQLQVEPSETSSVNNGAPSERTLAEPAVNDENAAPAPVSAPSKNVAEVDDSDPVIRSLLNKEYTNPLQKEKLIAIAKVDGSFKGYEDPPRTRLAMSDDDRPKISLWGILKSMVGKDMTKMALPVSFNEPTSLLQRVAEDMEYTHLLDTAAQQEDSTLRMVYIAAFAASEYASTINRVAKPFNPLLGETYEYARPDRNFRFLVEQVSHHPPISAAMAESMYWDYYGESFVKSKFYGRSFDIKPLGDWFLNLRPNQGSINSKTGAVNKDELYTWKKVTSSVVGIIVGNPTVDNYGDMEILNHNTGDSIVFSFKPRGWRESSAYEVKGTVLDAKKQPRWQVSGHWNSKIFAKKIGDKKKSEIFLVWEANPRPKIPFNLTEFATSLNAPQEHLIEWLPRTDTRFRPDQRAMEDGRYDEAVTEKERVEEKQRAAKRERDAKGQTYTPLWFVKKKHPVTGEEYWHYTGKYWKKRLSNDLSELPDIF